MPREDDPYLVSAHLLAQSTSSDELAKGWRAAFDLLADFMGFAHVGLVTAKSDEVAHAVELGVLKRGAEASRTEALPSVDRPLPLGTHIELGEAHVRAAVRHMGPRLLNVMIYTDSDRALMRIGGAGAALPMLDIHDFGKVLHIDASPDQVVAACGDGGRFSTLQAWLERAAAGYSGRRGTT